MAVQGFADTCRNSSCETVPHLCCTTKFESLVDSSIASACLRVGLGLDTVHLRDKNRKKYT